MDEVAEWLRRWTANPMCSARVGSNPILVEKLLLHQFYSVIVHQGENVLGRNTCADFSFSYIWERQDWERVSRV